MLIAFWGDFRIYNQAFGVNNLAVNVRFLLHFRKRDEFVVLPYICYKYGLARKIGIFAV